jgi:predicted homoserine dehydrogenase-like protein
MGTVGPVLKVYADKAGVVFTNDDGDQPVVIMNLYRFVKRIGVRFILCGNIKGLRTLIVTRLHKKHSRTNGTRSCISSAHRRVPACLSWKLCGSASIGI